MPVSVSMWACAFGCKRRPLASRSAMARHEKTCAMNPGRRACKICKHKRHAWLPAEVPGVAGAVQAEPACALQAMPYGSLMHFNCEKWEPRK